MSMYVSRIGTARRQRRPEFKPAERIRRSRRVVYCLDSSNMYYNNIMKYSKVLVHGRTGAGAPVPFAAAVRLRKILCIGVK